MITTPMQAYMLFRFYRPIAQATLEELQFVAQWLKLDSTDMAIDVLLAAILTVAPELQ